MSSLRFPSSRVRMASRNASPSDAGSARRRSPRACIGSNRPPGSGRRRCGRAPRPARDPRAPRPSRRPEAQLAAERERTAQAGFVAVFRVDARRGIDVGEHLLPRGRCRMEAKLDEREGGVGRDDGLVERTRTLQCLREDGLRALHVRRVPVSATEQRHETQPHRLVHGQERDRALQEVAAAGRRRGRTRAFRTPRVNPPPARRGRSPARRQAPARRPSGSPVRGGSRSPPRTRRPVRRASRRSAHGGRNAVPSEAGCRRRPGSGRGGS